MDQRHVLITGCSTGIGQACAERLACRGWIVHAGVRRSGDAAHLQASSGGSNIRPLLLDITEKASIEAAVAMVEAHCGDIGLAGLVNNAGISVNAPIELVPIEGWRRQFEVNLFGHIAVTQAFLPHLRRFAQRAQGPRPARIVMMGSIAGRLSQPVIAPYCSSKFALRAVADALRVELWNDRIGVCLVEPGATKSEIWRKAQEDETKNTANRAGDPAAPRYDHMNMLIAKVATRAEHHAIPALRVARVVERCLVSYRPPGHILVGWDARVLAALRALLPSAILDAAMAYIVRARPERSL